MKTQILKSILDTIKSILIFGFSWFAIGFIGPVIIDPATNLGPLLGIAVTGPIGVVLGGILGIISTFIDTKNKINPSNKFRLFPKIWNRILWSSAGLAVIVIVSACIYLPIYENKKSEIIRKVSDLQKRDKSLIALRVRSLADEDIFLLESYKQLERLNFFAGDLVREAKITDVGLKNLSELNLPNLNTLQLGKCDKITDEGLQYVSQLTNLYFLGLSDCPKITDAGISFLALLPRLGSIDLSNCPGITDQGVNNLKKIETLRWISIGGCINVTDSAIIELQKALPLALVEKNLPPF